MVVRASKKTYEELDFIKGKNKLKVHQSQSVNAMSVTASVLQQYSHIQMYSERVTATDAPVHTSHEEIPSYCDGNFTLRPSLWKIPT